MTNYPKFAKMQKMFQLKKNASNSKGKAIVNVKIVTTDVNVIDVMLLQKMKS
jgi:hypothetical protein